MSISAADRTRAEKGAGTAGVAHLAMPGDETRALCGAHLKGVPTRSTGRCVVCWDLARRWALIER